MSHGGGAIELTEIDVKYIPAMSLPIQRIKRLWACINRRAIESRNPARHSTITDKGSENESSLFLKKEATVSLARETEKPMGRPFNQASASYPLNSPPPLASSVTTKDQFFHVIHPSVFLNFQPPNSLARSRYQVSRNAQNN